MTLTIRRSPNTYASSNTTLVTRNLTAPFTHKLNALFSCQLIALFTSQLNTLFSLHLNTPFSWQLIALFSWRHFTLFSWHLITHPTHAPTCAITSRKFRNFVLDKKTCQRVIFTNILKHQKQW